MKPTEEQMKDMLRIMLTIRGFEETACALYVDNWESGNFLGALHSYEGQEAVATGACACLRDDDYVFSTHRGHGHFIAKGGDVKAMFAELLGKEAGCSRGRGGSMHMFDPEKGLMGGNGIVGGGIPLALGPAFAANYRGTDQVTVSFFGDGASSQGVFHESLNLAALWDLPLVFVCENNRYAVGTPASQGISVPNVSVRAAGYGCPGVTVDGDDPVAVYEAVSEAVAHARAGNGPSLVEAVTHRYSTHCMVMREGREQSELDEMKEHDPIPRFEQYLQQNGIISADEVQALRTEVSQLIEEAVAFGEDAPFPDPATVADGLWVS